jgi:hypothetical protein
MTHSQPYVQTIPAHRSTTAVRRKLSQGLVELGRLGTPDAIARFLGDRGFTGRPTFTRECPVAKFLQQKTGWSDLAVDATYAVACGGIMSRVCRIPDPVSAFVRKFDRGEYPVLERYQISMRRSTECAVPQT